MTINTVKRTFTLILFFHLKETEHFLSNWNIFFFFIFISNVKWIEGYFSAFQTSTQIKVLFIVMAYRWSTSIAIFHGLRISWKSKENTYVFEKRPWQNYVFMTVLVHDTLKMYDLNPQDVKGLKNCLYKQDKKKIFNIKVGHACPFNCFTKSDVFS